MGTATATPVLQKKRFNYQSLQQSLTSYPGAWALIAALGGGFFYLAFKSHWNVALFRTIDATNITGLLMPLIVVSAVIERAVEVVISPWRDSEGDRKQNTLQAASTLAATVPESLAAVSTLQDANDDLAQFTGQTRRYAFALAVVFSVMAVTAGVRVLWPMLDENAVRALPADQLNYLRWYDMVLSTLLLAGGAAGIHAPISAVTGFFQKNS